MPIVICQSPAFRSVRALLLRYARSDAQVLIEGETGTGKELAAREIHYSSPRRDQPFVPVNCGAMQDGLIENELFGHSRGAFTDAREAQVGLVEHARGGTLFLDEIDSLSHKAQVTLLRFLQDNEYRPIGGTVRTSGARIIAATNCHLGQLVLDGGFRSDLLYRLNVLYVHLPPLRERDGDVGLLAEHFLAATTQRMQGPRRRWSSDALRVLSVYAWPGNVRELENVVLRVYTLADSEMIGVEELLAAEPAIGESRRQSHDGQSHARASFRYAKARAIEAFEHDYLTGVLQQAGGNVTDAARLAGKERRALGKLLKKHRIERLPYRP
jgi:DNA-binding NtrC family response regulator